jgi:IS1 family transposase
VSKFSVSRLKGGILKEFQLHQEFFSYFDYVQQKYELLREVKYEDYKIAEAIKIHGYKSRYNFYFYWRQFQSKGFPGLFDLRFNKAISKYLNQISLKADKLRQVYGCNRTKLFEDNQTKLTFSERRKTAFFGLHGENKRLCQVIKAVGEGVGVRGISRIWELDKNTVTNYLKRSAIQCRRVSDYFLSDLHVEECQMDEMWSFVKKKEKNLDDFERHSGKSGDVWIYIAFDARNKLIVEYQMGKRTFSQARLLLYDFKQRTDGHIPFFTTDDLKYYKKALLIAYGKRVRNRDGEEILKPPSDLKYAIVKKKRKKGRVISIELKIVFGKEEEIYQFLRDSPISNQINTSFIERNNLTLRHYNKRLSRKTMSFSRKLENHWYQFEIERALYHFVKPHRGLKLFKPNGTYSFITPMMAAGKTDHIWTIEELLSFNPD